MHVPFWALEGGTVHNDMQDSVDYCRYPAVALPNQYATEYFTTV